MKLYKTFYLGCDDNGEIATHENRVIRFHQNLAHRPMMSALCPHFYNAQLMAEENTADGKPYKVAIFCPKNKLDRKQKPSNDYTMRETLYWFLENMYPPKNGMIVSIYTIEQFVKYIWPYEDYKHVWPLKPQWHWQGDGDYITLQDIEELTKDVMKKEFKSHPNYEIIKEIDKHSIYPVKRIDYRMSEDKIFNLLKHSKFNMSYPGGTYYTAAMMGCPTLGLYLNKELETINYRTREGILTTAIIERTMSENIINTCKYGYYNYDFETERAVCVPQTYLKHVSNAELLLYLKGHMENV